MLYIVLSKLVIPTLNLLTVGGMTQTAPWTKAVKL